MGVRGWAHSIARTCVPMQLISSPLTHVVYLFPFLSYLAGSKAFPPARPSVHQSDPETTANTVLEATASSSGKNVSY